MNRPIRTFPVKVEHGGAPLPSRVGFHAVNQCPFRVYSVPLFTFWSSFLAILLFNRASKSRAGGLAGGPKQWL